MNNGILENQVGTEYEKEKKNDGLYIQKKKRKNNATF